ncbi:MAG TPA: CoA-binding protein, partial [Albitalea sp.]|nr:CoA-binding protein [Albitalea sp.]
MENFQNPTEQEIKALLQRVRTIAVVGLSPRPNRPSHQVASQMQRFGYRIIPVRPAVDTVLGEQAYPSLEEVPERVDLVDVFRAPEHVD